MELVLEHLKEHAVLYGLGAACILPLIFVTKRWSVPFILYTVEIAVYFTMMHVLIWTLVRLAVWFKDKSSMRALREDGVTEGTPDWLMWFELVLAAIIVGLVMRYRPMKTQRKKRPRPGQGRTMMKNPRKYAMPPLPGKGRGKSGAKRRR